MCTLFSHYECKSEVMKRLFFKVFFATDANYRLESLTFYGINTSKLQQSYFGTYLFP